MGEAELNRRNLLKSFSAVGVTTALPSQSLNAAHESLEFADATSVGEQASRIVNAVSQGEMSIHATVSGMSAQVVPAKINAVRVNGYNLAGDSGDGHLAVDQDNGTEAWFQTSDSRGWYLSTRFPTPHLWGGRTASDINKSFRYARDMGGLSVHLDGGDYFIDDQVDVLDSVPLILQPNTRLVRAGGYIGAMLRSENFDALTGTNDLNCPKNITILGRGLIDGRYLTDQNPDGTFNGYEVANGGDNLGIYAKRVFLEVNSRNAGGVGVWSEAPSNGGPSNVDDGRQGHVWIDTAYTKYEGIVWRGPSDHQVSWMLQKAAGEKTVTEQALGPTVSPTYGATNGGFCDGIVLATGGEFTGSVHAFGNRSGRGISIQGGRVIANAMIAETNRYGGMRIVGGHGRIVNLNAHRTGGYGGDTQPHLFFDTAGVDSLSWELFGRVYNSDTANATPRNLVELGPNARHLRADLGLTGDNVPGHGVVIDASATWYELDIKANRINGTAADCLAASAIYRKAGADNRHSKITGFVQNADVAVRTQGTPYSELIDVVCALNAGQSIHEGDSRAYPGQVWNIRGYVDTAYRAKVSDNRQYGGPTLFISNDEITYPDHMTAIIDTEGGVAADDLVNILGGAPGDMFTISTATSEHDVTVVSGIGNIRLNGETNRTLSWMNDRLVLKKSEVGTWDEISFADNG